MADAAAMRGRGRCSRRACSAHVVRPGSVVSGSLATAMAPPGLGAPAVGDCLSRVLRSLGDARCWRPVRRHGLHRQRRRDIDDVRATAQVLTSVRSSPYRQMPTRPSRRATPTARAERSPAAASAVSDGRCSRWLPTIGSTPSRFGNGADVMWEPAAGQRFVVILSAPKLDPTEPRWAACAVMSPGLEPYSGSYLRSLADAGTGPLRSLPFRQVPSDPGCRASGRTAMQEFGTAARRHCRHRRRWRLPITDRADDLDEGRHRWRRVAHRDRRWMLDPLPGSGAVGVADCVVVGADSWSAP